MGVEGQVKCEYKLRRISCAFVATCMNVWVF